MSDRLDGWSWHAPEEPELPDQRRKAPRRPPRTWLRDVWPTLRIWLAIALAGALLLTGWETYQYLTRYHESTDGPHGAFPSALGKGAPERPNRVAAVTGDSALGVIGGLSVHPRTDGVRTRRVRGGDTFWRYRREGAEVVDTALGEKTVVQWWDDHVVVGLDIRSGKPRWHAELPYDAAITANVPYDIRIRDGRVIASLPRSFTALDEADGERLWTASLPAGCAPEPGTAVHAMAGVVAVQVRECGSGPDNRLLGLDSDTGAVRWHVPDPYLSTYLIGEHALVWNASTGVRVDVADGRRPDVRPYPEARHTVLVEADEDIVLTHLHTPDMDDTEAAIQGRDPESYAVRWSLRPAPGRRLGSPLAVDGKVYVVQQLPEVDGAVRPAPSELLVLDGASGRRLHTARLPELSWATDPEPGDMGELIPWSAADGVVTVRWSGSFTGVMTRTLVVAE